jgi:hypothetical protein
LTFLPIQLSSYFLQPLIEAFQQLSTVDLEHQIAQLPLLTMGLVSVFTGMNQQIDSLSQFENDDVKRRIPEVQARLTKFRENILRSTESLMSQIATGVIAAMDTAVATVREQSLQIQALSVPGAFAQPLGAIAALRQTREALGPLQVSAADLRGIDTQIQRIMGAAVTNATQIVADALGKGADQFAQALAVTLAIPEEIAGFDTAFGGLVSTARKFAPVVKELVGNIATFETSLTPLPDQVAAVATSINDLRGAIAAAGEDFNVALPLYDNLRQAIVAQADLQIQLAQAAHEQAIAQQQAVIQGTQASIQAQQEAINVQQEAIRAQEQHIQALQDEAKAHEDVVTSLQREVEQLEALRTRIGGTIRAEQPAVRAVAEIRGGLAERLSRVGGETGDAQLNTLQELVGLNEELINVGRESKQLRVVQEGMENLRQLQASTLANQIATREATISREQAALDAAQAQVNLAQGQLTAMQANLSAQQAQLSALQAQLTVQQGQLATLQSSVVVQAQIRDIQSSALAQLQGLQQQLYDLFVSSSAIQRAVAVAPEQDTAKQTLGVLSGPIFGELNFMTKLLYGLSVQANVPGQFQTRQRGGMVHTMLEPGEMVFPRPGAALAALETVNRAYPRFAVGGRSEGDSVPMALPRGAFVLNRRASAAVSHGYQSGGLVAASSPVTFNVSITLHANVSSDTDIRALSDKIARHLEQQFRSRFGQRRPGQG